MSSEFEQKLAKYGEVIVRVGLNLRAGQRLMIGSPNRSNDGTHLEAYQLVRHVVRSAYRAGAKYVDVNFDDEELLRIRLQEAPIETLGEFPTWKNDAAAEFMDNGDAVLAISGQNPDLLGDLDQEKVKAKQTLSARHLQKMMARRAAPVSNWLIVGASTSGWAAKVFPNLEIETAKARLWDAIFSVCRINEADPVAAWERHLADLAKRTAYLNGKRYTALKYTAPGTDLTVGLPDGHIWHSGGLTAKNGVKFVANVPTEEVFTLPHKDRVEGVVRATKPLSIGGSLIEDFTLKISEGVVVNAVARTGQHALDTLLNTDKASRSLGEVALVPHSSPISQSGILFYNILYDENASNHIALGNAYRFSIQSGDKMSSEEFASAGGNESMTHADFMVGSGEMNIDGITASGQAEPVMRNGEWAFKA